jgi:hypothetical protein
MATSAAAPAQAQVRLADFAVEAKSSFLAAPEFPRK